MFQYFLIFPIEPLKNPILMLNISHMPLQKVAEPNPQLVAALPISRCVTAEPKAAAMHNDAIGNMSKSAKTNVGSASPFLH